MHVNIGEKLLRKRKDHYFNEEYTNDVSYFLTFREITEC